MGKTTHGMSHSKEYRCWRALKNRCLNPRNAQYKDYGGRGITISKSWLKFENFYSDMGNCPVDCEIDRIDNEKGYSKENCRWTSKKINNRNRRNNKTLTTHLGEMVQAEMLEKIGWSKDQLRWYVSRYGIDWVLKNYKAGNLPSRVNEEIDRQDIVGKKFGDWEVLRFESYTKKKGHLYLCKCKCGKERLIPRNNLIREKTTCCRSCSAKKFWKNRT
jgi:hypothetical protein